MPGYTLDTQNLGPLFPSNDPLLINLPDPEGGEQFLTFHAVDDPILPDDSQYGLDSRPRTSLIDHLVSQVVEDEQPQLRKVTGELWDMGIISERHISELFTFLREEREKARKARLKRVTMRPTGAPSPLAPSSPTDPTT